MSKNIRTTWILSGILIAGLLFRLHKLGARSIWFDEAAINVAERYLAAFGPALEAWSKSRGLTFPYFALLSGWHKMAGNEFILRLPSVLFGTAAILMMFAAGEFLFNRKTGLTAAFLLAISPFHIYYSQEVSPYSLVVLLSLTSLYLFTRYLKERSLRFLPLAAAVSIMAIYIHLSYILIFFAETLFILSCCRKESRLVRNWLIVDAAIFLSLIPMMLAVGPRLVEITARSAGLGWLKLDISWINLLYTLKNFSIGYNAVPVMYMPAVLLFFGLCALAWIKSKFRENIILLSACLLSPVLAVYAVSHYAVCYVDRYFIAGLPFYLLITAAGIMQIRKFRGIIYIAVVVFSLAALRNYYADYLPGEFIEHIGIESHKDFRGAAGYVISKMESNDGIFHTCENTTLPFTYYFEKSSVFNIANNLILRINEGNDQLQVDKYSLEVNQSALPADINLKNCRRFWVIVSDWSSLEETQPEAGIVRYLKDRFSPADYRQYQGITVYLFRG